MSNADIPPETGAPEVEILEFLLAGQSFGVDVGKIQAIEQFDPTRITRSEPTHPSVIGHLRFRDDVLTMIDPAEALGACRPGCRRQPGFTATDRSEDSRSRLALVMELNRSKTAFLVDGVRRVHRVSRDSISPPSPGSGTFGCRVTGSLKIEDRRFPIVDLEEIAIHCDLLETVGA